MYSVVGRDKLDYDTDDLYRFFVWRITVCVFCFVLIPRTMTLVGFHHLPKPAGVFQCQCDTSGIAGAGVRHSHHKRSSLLFGEKVE